MSNDEQFILYKAALMDVLEKKGSSIEDFEKELEAGNIKVADQSLFSKGVDMGKDLFTSGAKGAGSIGAHFLTEYGPAALFGGSMVAGTALGGTLYGANKSLDNEDKALAEKQQLVDRYRSLTDRIKSDYGIH